MLAYDVFSNDVFTGTDIQEAVGNIVYIPQMLAQMNLFEVEPLLTTTVGVYKKNETLEFVPTTERGAPRSLPGRDSRSLVSLRTVNLRQEDRINSHEVQNLVTEFMPFDTALARADDEVDRRFTKLVRKLELTREYHRFAALNGILLDADGSVIFNFFQEFGLTQPAAIVFDFPNTTQGALRTKIAQQVYRPMMRQLNARKGPNTQIGALCSDSFYDKMIQAPEIYESYKIQMAGAELRANKVWGQVEFAGVTWYNFQGTDDNSTIAIPDGTCRFFPIGATDIYKEYRAPGEEWREVNQSGKEFYPYVVPDPRAPEYMAFVDLYLDAHPLFACIAPDVLMRGVLAN